MDGSSWDPLHQRTRHSTPGATNAFGDPLTHGPYFGDWRHDPHERADPEDRLYPRTSVEYNQRGDLKGTMLKKTLAGAARQNSQELARTPLAGGSTHSTDRSATWRAEHPRVEKASVAHRVRSPRAPQPDGGAPIHHAHVPASDQPQATSKRYARAVKNRSADTPVTQTRGTLPARPRTFPESQTRDATPPHIEERLKAHAHGNPSWRKAAPPAQKNAQRSPREPRLRRPSPQRRESVVCTNNAKDPRLIENGGSRTLGKPSQCVSKGFGAALYQEVPDKAAFVRRFEAPYEKLIDPHLWYKNGKPPAGMQRATLPMCFQRGYGAGTAALARKLKTELAGREARNRRPSHSPGIVP